MALALTFVNAQSGFQVLGDSVEEVKIRYSN